MSSARPFWVPFLLISAIAASTEDLNEFIDMPFMITLLKALNTENGVIFKNAIVAFES
jgi:hypothetical protein